MYYNPGSSMAELAVARLHGLGDASQHAGDVLVDTCAEFQRQIGIYQKLAGKKDKSAQTRANAAMMVKVVTDRYNQCIAQSSGGTGAAPATSASGYYVSVNGTQTGPFDVPTLTAQIQSGQLTGATLVLQPGTSTWVPASSVPALATVFASIPATTGQYYVSLNGVQSGPYTVTTLQSMIAAGQITSASSVLQVGTVTWMQAGSVPALASLFNTLTPTALFFISQNGQQQGPYAVQQLQQMIPTGQLNSSTLVMQQGTNQWVTAGSVPALAALFTATPSSPYSYPVVGGYLPGTEPQYPYGYSGSPGTATTQPVTAPDAVAASKKAKSKKSSSSSDTIFGLSTTTALLAGAGLLGAWWFLKRKRV